MSDNRASDHKWEPWQLSAFVLGELDKDVSDRITVALESDSMLRREVSEIRKTVTKVENALDAESRWIRSEALGTFWEDGTSWKQGASWKQGTLPAQGNSNEIREQTGLQRSDRLETIFRLADESEQLSSHEADVSLPNRAVEDGGGSFSNRESVVGRWRLTAIGLLAMSACLFVAAWMSLPHQNGKPRVTDPVAANSAANSAANQTASSVDRVSLAEGTGIADKTLPKVASITEEVTIESGTDAEIESDDQADELQRELASASELGNGDWDASESMLVEDGVLLADNGGASPEEPVVAESIEGAFALGALDDLAASGDLFGDVSIDYLEEIDLVIVRGSQRDVKRTMDVIDARKRVLQDLKTNQVVLGQPAPGFTGDAEGFAGDVPGFGGFDGSVEMQSAGGLGAGLGGFGGGLREGFTEAIGEGVAESESPSKIEASDEGYSLRNQTPVNQALGSEGRNTSSTEAQNLERTSLYALQLQEQEVVKKLGEKHPQVAKLRQRIATLEERIERIRNSEQQYPPRLSAGRFGDLYENPFRQVVQSPLSTFSVDVDTASYAKTRQLLLDAGRLPPSDAVRTEEFVNYFEYEYYGPEDNDRPFGANLAISDCPWQPRNKLVRIALQAEDLQLESRPEANIVFLLDVSGSMSKANKLPLVKESLKMMVEQLGENDRIAIVVYADGAKCVLESTSGSEQEAILVAVEGLKAGGSTNGGEGIQLAYQMARDQFVAGGVNRIVLCTDGDFNVGMTSTEELIDLVEENAKGDLFLTVLGFGMEDTNDEMLEEITNRGNGIYGFIDNRREAHRQMVQQLIGNLVNVAKDVKIQVEFNPKKVKAYRLLGYENRTLTTEDFEDDSKDAGEIGAGHQVTALYEIAPANSDVTPGNNVRPLRYQSERYRMLEAPEDGAESGITNTRESSEYEHEWLCVSLKYKPVEGDESRLLEYPLATESKGVQDMDRDFRWAASMVEFAMLLKDSRYAGVSSWDGVIARANDAAGLSPNSDRQECLEMIHKAAELVEVNRRNLRQQR